MDSVNSYLEYDDIAAAGTASIHQHTEAQNPETQLQSYTYANSYNLMHYSRQHTC
jgi:predicted metal-dependent phosphoesterase TrpH